MKLGKIYEMEKAIAFHWRNIFKHNWPRLITLQLQIFLTPTILWYIHIQ